MAVWDRAETSPGRVLTGDSFFHLSALGESLLSGLNLCGTVVCLIDPAGLCACPCASDETSSPATCATRGFPAEWQQSEPFADLRNP